MEAVAREIAADEGNGCVASGEVVEGGFLGMGHPAHGTGVCEDSDVNTAFGGVTEEMRQCGG